MLSRATCPYQGHVDAGPKGASWPGWNRTSVLARFKAAVPLPTEQPAIRALPQGRTGRAALTGGHRTPVRRASCPRRDSDPHCPPPQGGASCRWATRTEPPPGVEPGLRPYGGRAAAVRGGEAPAQGLEPQTSWLRTRCSAAHSSLARRPACCAQAWSRATWVWRRRRAVCPAR